MTKRGRVQSGDLIVVPGVGTFKVTPLPEAIINAALGEAETKTVHLQPVGGTSSKKVNLRQVLNAILIHGGLRRSGGAE